MSICLHRSKQKALAADVPFVMIANDGDLQHVNYVGTDEEAAGRLAADYICNPENSLIARNTEAAIIAGAATDAISKAHATGGHWGLEDCRLKVVEEENTPIATSLSPNACHRYHGQTSQRQGCACYR